MILTLSREGGLVAAFSSVVSIRFSQLDVIKIIESRKRRRTPQSQSGFSLRWSRQTLGAPFNFPPNLTGEISPFMPPLCQRSRRVGTVVIYDDVRLAQMKQAPPKDSNKQDLKSDRLLPACHFLEFLRRRCRDEVVELVNLLIKSLIFFTRR